ncbi:DUF4406 domain-containing protein [Conexibacter stalactiti]
MVLIAGPYRSGTGDDPALIARNERAMHEVALEVFRRGHLAVTGEALALPLIRLEDPEATPGTPRFDEIFHPLARRLVARCDAVLRIGGPSAGADEMVALARDHGAAVLTGLDELPEVRG